MRLSVGEGLFDDKELFHAGGTVGGKELKQGGQAFFLFFRDFQLAGGTTNLRQLCVQPNRGIQKSTNSV